MFILNRNRVRANSDRIGILSAACDGRLFGKAVLEIPCDLVRGSLLRAVISEGIRCGAVPCDVQQSLINHEAVRGRNTGSKLVIGILSTGNRGQRNGDRIGISVFDRRKRDILTLAVFCGDRQLRHISRVVNDLCGHGGLLVLGVVVHRHRTPLQSDEGRGDREGLIHRAGIIALAGDSGGISANIRDGLGAPSERIILILNQRRNRGIAAGGAKSHLDCDIGLLILAAVNGCPAFHRERHVVRSDLLRGDGQRTLNPVFDIKAICQVFLALLDLEIRAAIGNNRLVSGVSRAVAGDRKAGNFVTRGFVEHLDGRRRDGLTKYPCVVVRLNLDLLLGDRQDSGNTGNGVVPLVCLRNGDGDRDLLTGLGGFIRSRGDFIGGRELVTVQNALDIHRQGGIRFAVGSALILCRDGDRLAGDRDISHRIGENDIIILVVGVRKSERAHRDRILADRVFHVRFGNSSAVRNAFTAQRTGQDGFRVVRLEARSGVADRRLGGAVLLLGGAGRDRNGRRGDGQREVVGILEHQRIVLGAGFRQGQGALGNDIRADLLTGNRTRTVAAQRTAQNILRMLLIGRRQSIALRGEDRIRRHHIGVVIAVNLCGARSGHNDQRPLLNRLGATHDRGRGKVGVDRSRSSTADGDDRAVVFDARRHVTVITRTGRGIRNRRFIGNELADRGAVTQCVFIVGSVLGFSAHGIDIADRRAGIRPGQAGNGELIVRPILTVLGGVVARRDGGCGSRSDTRRDTEGHVAGIQNIVVVVVALEVIPHIIVASVKLGGNVIGPVRSIQGRERGIRTDHTGTWCRQQSPSG